MFESRTEPALPNLPAGAGCPRQCMCTRLVLNSFHPARNSTNDDKQPYETEAPNNTVVDMHCTCGTSSEHLQASQ
jgi:hypothetical protein